MLDVVNIDKSQLGGVSWDVLMRGIDNILFGQHLSPLSPLRKKKSWIKRKAIFKIIINLWNYVLDLWFPLMLYMVVHWLGEQNNEKTFIYEGRLFVCQLRSPQPPHLLPCFWYCCWQVLIEYGCTKLVS
jgi:hypothetical protein